MKRRKTAYKQHKTVIHKEWRTVNIYQTSMTTYQMQEIRRALAKQANQRMVRLERTTSKITGDTYTFGAYDVAQEYLRATGKVGKDGKGARFSERKEAYSDMSELRREISTLQNFLNAPSSTISGMREIEKQRIKTFEEQGIHFANTKEFYDFANSEEFNELRYSFDSDQVVEIYDEAREKLTHEEIVKRMSQAVEDYGNRTTRASIKDLRSRMGLDPEL